MRIRNVVQLHTVNKLQAFGWPLVICGALKIVYDLLLLGMFSAVKPPEEKQR